MNKPLITMTLVAYNQMGSIREAIEGAFAQEYSPLEILLSDDASNDGTYEIMQEMSGAYRGSSRVTLNQNPSNLGIIEHVNRVTELASGDLIVGAAGDDVSFPDRVTKTFELWKEHGFRPDLLYFNRRPFGEHSWTYTVDPEKHSLGSQIQNGGADFAGATAAWTKRLFSFWGPLPNWVSAEDKIIPFRAELTGGIACSNEPIIDYRQNRPQLILTGQEAMDGLHVPLEEKLLFYKSFELDLKFLREKCPERDLELNVWARKLQKRKATLERDLGLLKGGRTSQLVLVPLVLAGRTWARLSLRQRLSLARNLLKYHIGG